LKLFYKICSLLFLLSVISCIGRFISLKAAIQYSMSILEKDCRLSHVLLSVHPFLHIHTSNGSNAFWMKLSQKLYFSYGWWQYSSLFRDKGILVGPRILMNLHEKTMPLSAMVILSSNFKVSISRSKTYF